jgi:hypothetical protein
MMSRCYNPNSTGYKYYGGRGIEVCDKWKESFINFYSDMGPRPEGHSLDRIDVNGDYTPTNCRWATYEQQASNKSDNVLLEWEDSKKTVSEWARILGILPNTIQYRLYRGWSVAEALGKEARVIPKKYTTINTNSEYILEQLNNGRTQSDIARELGVDSSNISRFLKKTNEERNQNDS